MNWLAIAIGAIFSSLFYWAGGRGRDFSKGFFFKSIVRDVGCTLVFGLCVLSLIGLRPTYIGLTVLSMAGLWGALSTYHKWLNRLLGRKNEKLDVLNFSFTGLCYGLSSLPLVLADIGILPLLIRCAVLSCLVGGFSLLRGKEIGTQISEALIGASIIATLSIFEVI